MTGASQDDVINDTRSEFSHILRLHTKSHLFISLWPTSGVYGLTAATLTAIILAVTYECVGEYLLFLRNRSRQRKTGPDCCGHPVVSCWEKLIQAFVHLLRVLISYLMMLCVMTMNVWLLVAVVVGATVGYGIGKPLVANAIMDILSSYEYKITSVSLNHGKSNQSQRSMSWRYNPMETIDNDSDRLREEIELLTNIADESRDDVFGNGELSSRTEVIWLRRSQVNLNTLSDDASSYDDKVELRPKDRHKDGEALDRNINDSGHSNILHDSVSRSPSRFKSTSKVINESMRSSRSDSYRGSLSRQSAFSSLDRTDSRHSSARNSPMNSPGRPDRQAQILVRNESNASRSSGNVGLNRSTSSASGRFKPVSRQISKGRTN